jgi:hypothetical protein
MNHAQHLGIAERLATALDSQFGFGPWRFGLDPIIGLLPVVGDVIPLLVSVYILWIGHRMGVPPHLRRRLIANAVADVVIGVIPVVGDVSDLFWRANTRNIKLLRHYLEHQPYEGVIIADNQALLSASA